MIEWLKITLMSAGWLSVGSQGLPELVTAIRPPFAPLGGLTMLTLVLCYPILKTYRTSRQGFSYTNESSLFAKALLVCTILVFALDFWLMRVIYKNHFQNQPKRLFCLGVSF